MSVWRGITLTLPASAADTQPVGALHSFSPPAAAGATAARPIRAFIVDDAEIMRATLAMVLEAAADVVVVGSAATGEEALAAIAGARPDVVVMDVRLPGVDGITVTRQLAERPFAPRVIVLSADDTTQTVDAAFAAGAAGYLVKGAVAGRLLEALRAVSRGQRFVGAPVARKAGRARVAQSA